MANYIGTFRTNYFKIKDKEKFENLLDRVSGIQYQWEGDSVMLMDSECADSGGMPNSILNIETDEYEDFDLPEAVSEHLQDDEVAIFMEVGSEKYRYLVGNAIAINSKKKTKILDISQIYKLAKKLTEKPDEISRAEY